MRDSSVNLRKWQRKVYTLKKQLISGINEEQMKKSNVSLTVTITVSTYNKLKIISSHLQIILYSPKEFQN